MPPHRRSVAAALAGAAALVPASADASVARLDSLERAVLHNINVVRGQHGLPGLRPSTRMSRVASRHSRDQLRHDRVTHIGSDGRSFQSRMSRVTRARRTGEVIGFLGARTRNRAWRIVELWMRSPPHRALLLDRGFRRAGVGRRHGRLGPLRGAMFTVNLATRR